MPRVGLAVASPSTLNTLLQTLSCTAFAIASQAENILPEDPGLRVVRAKLIKRATRECRSREGESLRGSITHNHRHEHVLRLEGELDPRSPRFEDAGLRSNGGGRESSAEGGTRQTNSRRCGKVRDRVRGRVQNIGAQGHLRSRSLPCCQGRVRWQRA